MVVIVYPRESRAGWELVKLRTLVSVQILRVVRIPINIPIAESLIRTLKPALKFILTVDICSSKIRIAERVAKSIIWIVLICERSIDRRGSLRRVVILKAWDFARRTEWTVSPSIIVRAVASVKVVLVGRRIYRIEGIHVRRIKPLIFALALTISIPSEIKSLVSLVVKRGYSIAIHPVFINLGHLRAYWRAWKNIRAIDTLF